MYKIKITQYKEDGTFDELPNECLELPTNAKNADTVEDAICCYIQYGEYSPENIWKEITSR